MRKLFVVIAALAAFAPATAANAATTTVTITPTGFKPDQVAIRPGDTVIWRNADNEPRQVVSNTGLFKSSVLKPGQSFAFRFAVESSYSYHGAFHPKQGGTVHVRSTRPTIGISRIRAVYGNTIRVFGSIPNGASGEQVTVRITPYGGPTTERVLIPDEGTFEFTYRPRIRTEFQVEWNGEASPRAPFIGVRPLVVFRPVNLRRNVFFVRAKAARSYAGKVVRIQRMNERGAWVTTRRVRLNRFGQARFVGRFPEGTTTARAIVTRAPGYEFGFSVTNVVRRNVTEVVGR
jgi:plastocyanin